MKKGIQLLVVCSVILFTACSLGNPGSGGVNTPALPGEIGVGTQTQGFGQVDTSTVTPPESTPLPPTPTIEIPDSATLTPELIEESSDTPAYTITIQSVKMEGDNFFAEPFNTAIKNLVDKERQAFIESTSQVEEWRAANIPDIRSALDGVYTLTYNENTLVSIHFEFSMYIAGAAHPNSYSITLTYNLQNQHVLQLADLFTPESDWLNALSTLCSTDLSNRGVLEFSEGAAPVIENYARWTINPEGLKIYFDPYQVIAYAAGPQQVIVPYTALADYIANPGVLADMLP